MKVQINILIERLSIKLFLSAVALLLTLPMIDAQAAGPALTHLPDSIKEVSDVPPVGPPNAHKPFISRHALKAEEQSAAMGFEVALKMRNMVELQQRVNNGERISRQEMAAKYEPLPSDYQAVAKWITSQGFQITRQSSNHLAIFASGKVSQIGQAMQVTFARVTSDGNEYTSAITAPSVPSAFAPLLIGVNGLQPHIRMHTHIMKLADASGTAPYFPSQIAQAYQVNGLYNQGITGAGQTIAIVLDAFPVQDDLISFWDAYGVNQSINNISFFQVIQGSAGTPSTDVNALQEVTLDTEWSSAMAPGAKVRVYAAPDLGSTNLDSAYQQILDDATAHPEWGMNQMSMSYGEGNIETGMSQRQTDDGYFLDLATAGVTCFASSGDNGATPGNNPNTLEVESPASDPNVIGVGGTTLTLNADGSVKTEVVWNGGASGGASGGGVSTSAGTVPYLNRPSWQTGNGVPNGTQRLVPDISCAADPNYGAAYYYTMTGANSGEVETTIGGTSWASPTCAAFCALINQARANFGLSSIGQMGPYIYPLIGTANFRDITSGNNSIIGKTNGVYNYTAGTGYDLATGIGVPLVQTLAETIAGTPTVVGVSQQSAFQTVNQGKNATFTDTATGSPDSYQWQQMAAGTTTWSNLSDSAVYSGSLTASLTVANTTTAMSGSQFQCVATYAGTAVTGGPTSTLVVENPWVITTLAGQATTAGGTINSGLQNGTGTGAQFNYPSGVTVDSLGNLYVADLQNNLIRKVTTAGVVTTFAGKAGSAGSVDGTGTAAVFDAPRDIAADNAHGLFYVSDEGSNAIRKITAAAVVSTISGSSTTFNSPKGVAVDGSGNLYVADYGNNVIRKITTNGTISILAGQSGTAGATNGTGTGASFNNPIGVAVDSATNVYVTDYGNELIRKITSSGVVSTLAGQAGVAGCLDGSGTHALFNLPRGVTVDSAGNLYVTDSSTSIANPPPLLSGNSLVRKISPAGVVTTIAGQAGSAGSADGTGSGAQFYNPCGITMSGNNTIYVTDASNNTIRAAAVPPASITLSVSPANGGTISGYAGPYLAGAPVSLLATANSGYTFSKWTDQNGVFVSGSNPYNFTIEANITLIANFVAPPAFTNGTTASATFASGQPNSYLFTATGYPPPTFSTSGLPTGVTLSSTGLLSSTSSLSGTGTYQFTITAGNGVGTNAQQTFTLNVDAAQPFVGNPTATPEYDGVPNLLKYVYDIDRSGTMTGADYAAMPTLATTTIDDTSYLTLTFREYALETGVTINVQISPDLQTWTTVAVLNASLSAPLYLEPGVTVTQIGNDPNTTTNDPILQAQVPMTATKQFMRLNVTQP